MKNYDQSMTTYYHERRYDEFYFELLSPIQQRYYREIYRKLMNGKYLLGLSVEKNNVNMDLQKAIEAFRKDHVKMYQLTGKYSFFWCSRTSVLAELEHYRYSGEVFPEDRVAEIVKMASSYRTKLMQLAAVYEYFTEHISVSEDREEISMKCPVLNAAISEKTTLEGKCKLFIWVLRELGIDCGIIYYRTGMMYCMVHIDIGCFPIDFTKRTFQIPTHPEKVDWLLQLPMEHALEELRFMGRKEFVDKVKLLTKSERGRSLLKQFAARYGLLYNIAATRRLKTVR